MKRTLSLFLAALMLASMLAGCGTGDNTTPADTTAAPTGDSATTPPAETAPPTHDAEGYLLDSLPADLDFGGEEVGILAWEDVEQPEFDVEAVTGDIIDDAIFERNRIVEERLGIKFAWYKTKGNNGNRDNYLNVAQNSYNAGDMAYDIYAAYSRTTALCAANGLCYNLMDVRYLDFEKPWWPDRLLETASVDNKLYFLSGDISTNLLHMMYGIYYNKDMYEKHQLEDPAELVLAGKWTLDKVIEQTKNMYADLNNNGIRDDKDQFGMGAVIIHFDAFYTGSDLKLVEQDETETLIISPDLSAEKTINLIEKLGAWGDTDDFYKITPVGNVEYENAFANGNGLMCVNRAYLATRKLRDVDFSYGIVPVPTYDEKQESFVTVMGNPFTLYAITRDCDAPDRVGAVLEALGSAAYRTTTPAVFEVSMKVKYSEDSIDAQMFDLIRESVDFDLGRLFAASLDDPIGKVTAAIWNNSNWASPAKTYQKMMGNMVKKLVNQLREID